jgi:hypothetical protein
MGKHTRYHGFSGHQPEAGEDTSLAAILLAGGLFERVEQRTAVDEAIEHEAVVLETEEAAGYIVPAEDYEELIAAYGKRAQGLDCARHRPVRAGVVVIEPCEIEALVMRGKVNALTAFMRYVWFDCDHLWDAMCNLLAITVRHAPQFVKGMSGAQAGKLIGVGRAAFNRRKLRLVEDFLERWGVTPTAGPGGKGVEHQQMKAAQMKGRKHRAAEYETQASEPEQTLTKRQLEALHQEHERERVANLAGVNPEDLDLAKTRPISRRDWVDNRRPGGPCVAQSA